MEKEAVYYYSWHIKTKKYIGATKAQLCPISKKRGSKVYLKPKNATFKKPVLEEEVENIWNGDDWEQIASTTIIIKPEKEIDIDDFGEEIKKTFGKGRCLKDGNKIIIVDIEHNLKNKFELGKIVDSHNFLEAEERTKNRKRQLSRNLTKVNLTAWKVLISKLNQTITDFPNFEEFEQLVIEEIKSSKKE